MCSENLKLVKSAIKKKIVIVESCLLYVRCKIVISLVEHSNKENALTPNFFFIIIIFNQNFTYL